MFSHSSFQARNFLTPLCLAIGLLIFLGGVVREKVSVRKTKQSRPALVLLASRALRLLLLCALGGLFALAPWPTPKASVTRARATTIEQAAAHLTDDRADSLNGAAAINYLNQQGAYESLMHAVRAEDSAAPSGLASVQDPAHGPLQIEATSTATALWSPQARLLASDGADADNFGLSVAISGDTAIVGSRRYRNGPDAGEAYIFVRSGSQWNEQAILRPPGSAAQINLFGRVVAISGNVAIVGALDVDQNGVTTRTIAYVYARDNAGVWSSPQELRAHDGDQYLSGSPSVAISGNTAIVGGYYFEPLNSGLQSITGV